MIRTQIQLPDQLYRKLKRLAEVQETSLAEVLRRAGEREIAAHPSLDSSESSWALPDAADLGIRSEVPVRDWTLLANEDALEPPSPSRRRQR